MTRMRKIARLLAISALAVAAGSCGDVVRSGRSPVFLIINSLQGIRGGPAGGTPTSTLTSDVITNVTTPLPCTTTAPCPEIFGDSGTVSLSLALKDIGTTGTPNTPTTNNQVTITSYHVAYVRADGHNVPGVDVPYAFDGAATITVPPTGVATMGFVLVRN